MSGPGALLFDLDGTLTDSRHGIVACIRHAMAHMGVAAADDEHALLACLGPPLRGSFAQLLRTDDAARVEVAMSLYRERFDSIGWRENSVYPGVGDALAKLATCGHRMYVCTSKPLVYAQRIVAFFGLDGFFAGVYGPGLDGTLDDKRELLMHVIRNEGLDPAHAWMIGDRYHDVRAARANGVHAIGVLWGYGSRAELADADALVSAPDEIACVLANNSA